MKTKNLVKCALMVSVIVAVSQISIPLPTGVPLTLQTFAIMLSGMVLGKRGGLTAAFVYILMGAAGLPVFAEFSGGLHVITGPTGGFVLTFPLMAYITGLAAEKSASYPSLFIGSLVSVIVNYAAGCVMFAISSNVSLGYAVAACAVPFLFTDFLKVILAVFIGKKVRSAVFTAVGDIN